MSDEEKTQNGEKEPRDLLVRDVPDAIHTKIEKRASYIHYQTGRQVTKADVVRELLETHPDIAEIPV